MKAFGKAVGTFQARLLLSLFYITLLVPFAILAKVVLGSSSGWCQRKPENLELERARMQF
jgi:hypothetical protein